MTNNYVEIFLEPLRECTLYRPKFGNSKKEGGFTLDEFLELYGSDPFYSWIGLNSPFLYAAHKASGSMTSLYRQIGIGCERLLRQIIFDTTGYEDYESTRWSYLTKTKAGKSKVLSLDGRLELADIRNEQVRKNVEEWIKAYTQLLGVNAKNMNGIVFEVRQGYKSKDSKRQNGDIDNATVAYAYNYLPVFAIFSSQIDADIVLRYTNNRCGILVGSMNSNKYVSLFAFCKEVLGYDLARFFSDNSEHIRREVSKILEILFKIDETKS